MSPAFSSTKQAGAFALLLLTILLLPVLVGKSALPPREQLYKTESIKWFGPYPFIHQQIFEEKGDIDIVFAGSSHILAGIDTRYVQKKLSANLGRPATVRTLGWTGSGFDALFFIIQDLLANRTVRMLVIHQEAQGRPIPHNVVPRLFRIGDGAEALTGLGTQAQASYYFAAILGMPGNLFSLMRSNLPVDPAKVESDRWRRAYNAEHFATTLGSLSAQIGYSARPGIDKADFVAYAPQTSAQPSDTSIYSPQTNAKFDFSGPRIPPEQLHFARKLALLTRQHQTKLVVLHLPDITESRANRIHERGSWPQSLETEPALVGIPPAALFAGLTDEEIKKLFFDWCHLNKNGQEYFTPLITPSLLKIYHVETKH